MTELRDMSRQDRKDLEDPMIANGRTVVEEGEKMPQYLVTLAVTMLVFSGGAAIGWLSPSLVYLQSIDSPIELTPEQGSWVGSLIAIGACIGALPAGSVADAIGRKNTALALSVPFLISWILIFFATGPGMLYAARFIAGIALGGCCAVVPMYLSEIAEGSIRGTLGSSFQFMLVTGILYAYVMGAIVSYRLLGIFCGVVPIIFVLAFFKAPESPIYLLKKDKRQQAEQALRSLRGKSFDVYKELHALENELANSSGTRVSFFKAVSQRASIRALIISLGLMFFQQLSGINIVIFYAGQIFEAAGSTLDPEIATIFVGLAQVLTTIVSAALVDRAGRKILLIFSDSLMAVCLAILGYYFYKKDRGDDVSSIGMVPLATVLIYIVIFAIGYGPIPWMMSGEVLPSEIKGVGTGIAVGLNWILAFTVTKTFQTLLDTIGTAKTYWFFAVICLFGVFFVWFVVIETKGKSMAEIQKELGGNSSRSSRRSR